MRFQDHSIAYGTFAVGRCHDITCPANKGLYKGQPEVSSPVLGVKVMEVVVPIRHQTSI